MKASILFAATLSLFSFAALAERQPPHIEPGPVQKLSDQTSAVVNLLFHPVVKVCMTQIQDHPSLEVRMGGVTFQALAPGRSQYIFSGRAFRGGDMPVPGSVSMVVNTNRGEGFGGQPTTFYTCSVTFPDVDQE